MATAAERRVGPQRGVPPEAARLRARAAAMGLTLTEVARAAGISLPQLQALLGGKNRTARALGYDRWPEAIGRVLDGYEAARPVVHRHAEAAVAELQAAKLPVPRALLLLIATSPRTRRQLVTGVGAGTGAKAATRRAGGR